MPDLRRMEERKHGPVDREGVTVDEAEVESKSAAETTPPAESQETGEEDVPEESIEKSRVEYQWPTTEGRITSAFGSREDAVPNPHPGIDIAPMTPGQKGQDILSAENGTVIFVGMSAGGSSEIHIEHTNGEVSIYKHHDVQSVQVKVGDGVYKGEKIAEMSDVGSPGAVHLHFEIRPSAGLRQKDAIDPVPKLPDIPATIHLTEAVERSGNTLKNK